MSEIALRGHEAGPYGAVLFDVDGTLYDAKPMRRAMLRALLVAGLRAPWALPGTFKGLQAYRHALEEQREELSEQSGVRIRADQRRRAAAASGLPEARIEQLASYWMEEKPLPAVARGRRPGLLDFVRELRERGIPMGAFSDYPVARKLEVLGVADDFCVQLDADDARIGALKPSPRGLIVGAELLGVPVERLLYVGDRSEVDAAAAQAAGAGCVLLGRAKEGDTAPRFADYHELLAALS
jgi:HAD superfamily hydrolase (TIGR01549 family)